MRAALLGLALLIAPGLLVASLVRPDPVVPAWPESPAAGTVIPDPPPRWDRPAGESLALLRRVTAKESRSARRALSACEASAARVAIARRVKAFRRCATRPLARVDGFGMANSRMLTNLAGSAGPTERCRRRVLSLSGLNGMLGGAARNTLRDWVATWSEMLASSRAIRAVAREASAFARAKAWRSTCRPLPPAKVEPAIA